MRALVTGAAGFVGRYLIDHLLACGDKVTAAVLPGTKPAQSVETVELDITEYTHTTEAISSVTPDVIYHLAGLAYAPTAESNFDLAVAVNVVGTHNVVRSAHLLNRPITVVFISSGEVYGRIKPTDVPIKEDQPLNPANNYSLTKLMAEQVIARYSSNSQVKTVVLRPFNHTGPGQDSQFVCSSFAKQLAEIKLGLAEPVLRVGNLDPQRDFSDVRDIVKAYRSAAVAGKGIYNLGSGKALSIKQAVEILIKASSVNVTIEPDPARIRQSEVPILYADISKAVKELDWKPTIPIEQTLSDLFNWWHEQLSSK